MRKNTCLLYSIFDIIAKKLIKNRIILLEIKIDVEISRSLNGFLDTLFQKGGETKRIKNRLRVYFTKAE